MKTYRNEQHGFEIDIPENWSPAPGVLQGLAKLFSGPLPPGVNKNVFQYGCYEEAFNFEIGPLFPEPLLDDTEAEFRLYAGDRGFTELRFGRITAGGRGHVCASYLINDRMGKRWNKKYMIVLGGVEYAITGTCNDPDWFANREKDWDAIIGSFRLLQPVDETAPSKVNIDRYRDQRREIVQGRIEMRELTGDLYAQAYEAVSIGNYPRARVLLELCLRDDPKHVLAHKELAVILEKQGDMSGALRQRREVRRLSPNDYVNRAKYVELLAGSGSRREALQEVSDYLTLAPNDAVFKELDAKLKHRSFPNHRLTFFSSLICLILMDISFFFSENIVITNVTCMSLLMLVPTWRVWVSGPWVGLSRRISGLIAGALYLYFLFQAW